MSADRPLPRKRLLAEVDAVIVMAPDRLAHILDVHYDTAVVIQDALERALIAERKLNPQ